ncbi:MAG TPA: hypothetical protein VK422_21010 [Pyrinomonadaceae bacterium]|nr:hypothetical protein [Pyrinomonadaceae bacterium]
MIGKYQPAFLAGGALGVALIVIGLIPALIPALGIVGCCACLLPIGAGIFAISQQVPKSPTPVQMADGAILGAIAGAVGGVIYLVIGVPLVYLVNSAAVAAQMEQLRESGIALPLAGFALAFVGGIFGVVVDAILGLVGGLIGISIFEKRKGGPNTPPPPPAPGGGYGGPTGGGYNDPTGGGYGGGQPGGGGGYGGGQPGGGYGGPQGGGSSYGQGS